MIQINLSDLYFSFTGITHNENTNEQIQPYPNLILIN